MINKILFLSATILAVLTLWSYKSMAQTQKEENQTAMTKNEKILIAYYSYSGNTKKVAEKIHETVGGDLFEIKAEGTYPSDYSAMTAQAKKEINDGFRPKLTTSVADIEQYDTVFIGSPNWWGTITPQISSFLETYNLSGKKVIPFITHGGGGKQNTVADLTAQCKGCLVDENAWTGYGSITFGLSDWLEKQGYGDK